MGYRIGHISEKYAQIVSLYEAKCITCGKDIFDTSLGFCDQCFKDIEVNSKKTCLRCGVPISGEEDFCGRCNFNEIFFDRAYSALIYEGSLIQAVYQIKYGGVATSCGIFANYLVYLAQKNKLKFDVVCYVPMTEAKTKKRGFNQAKVLAEYFCDYIERRILSNCLVKTRETEQQEKLNQKQRMENVKGVYKVTQPNDVKDKNVLLIDDVKTTGSTLNECSKMLKKAGAKKIYCLTVASRKQHLLVEEGENNAPNKQSRAKATAKTLPKNSKKKPQ